MFLLHGKTGLNRASFERNLVHWQDEIAAVQADQFCPNVDFYSGIIYEAMGFKPEQFTVLFGIPRTVGWLAQWQEMLQDPEQKIARPRQIYIGEDRRDFVPIEQRGQRELAHA